jgi:hypothetical protein
VRLDAEEELEVLGNGEGKAGSDEALDSFVVRSEVKAQAETGRIGDFVSDFNIDQLRDAFFAG